jgi:hypothetical protein
MRERVTKYSNTESKLSGHPTPLIQRLVPRVNDIGEEVKREPGTERDGLVPAVRTPLIF